MRRNASLNFPCRIHTDSWYARHTRCAAPCVRQRASPGAQVGRLNGAVATDSQPCERPRPVDNVLTRCPHSVDAEPKASSARSGHQAYGHDDATTGIDRCVQAAPRQPRAPDTDTHIRSRQAGRQPVEPRPKTPSGVGMRTSGPPVVGHNPRAADQESPDRPDTRASDSAKLTAHARQSLQQHRHLSRPFRHGAGERPPGLTQRTTRTARHSPRRPRPTVPWAYLAQLPQRRVTGRSARSHPPRGEGHGPRWCCRTPDRRLHMRIKPAARHGYDCCFLRCDTRPSVRAGNSPPTGSEPDTSPC